MGHNFSFILMFLAWNSGIVPQPGTSIDIPIETTIILNSTNISNSSYSGLNIPDTGEINY